MRLESLPNEILLELFGFFHAVDLLCTFCGLNSRFNTLLLAHFHHFHLDFRSISKKNFDLVCRQYLPLISDRIISLCLSNDDDTPQQTDLFLSRNLHFSQFIYLRSLSLYNIEFSLVLHTLIEEWRHLSHLTHLNLIDCIIHWRVRSPRLIDEIWKLPKLTHCHISTSGDQHVPLGDPTVTSSSLKFLSINGYLIYTSDLISLIGHTPYLRYLDLHLKNSSDSRALQFSFSSVTVLKITSAGPLQRLTDFLQNFPNLYHLTVKTRGQVDGHGWEQLITNYLFKTKIFQLKMEFPIRSNKEQQVDQLLNSFQSPFWLKERKWFVRCHWYPETESKQVSLYTLPYTFPEFILKTGMFTRSTCPSEDDYCSYDCVQNLSYSTSLSTLRFYNIRHLYLKFPFDKEFWSIVPNLDRVISICLSVCHIDEDSLQTLLKCAPHLSWLTYDSSSSITLNELLTLHSNLIVHRLDLQEYNHWFNEEECSQLTHSSLGKHCQVLKIKIKVRTSILDFIETMTKLCALHVQCQDDDRVNDTGVDEENVQYDDDLDDIFLPRQEELVKWLRHRLSTEFLISRDIKKLNRIQIWLR